MRRSVGDGFILNGKKTPIIPRSKVDSNSDLTATKLNLSHQNVFHESNRRPTAVERPTSQISNHRQQTSTDRSTKHDDDGTPGDRQQHHRRKQRQEQQQQQQQQQLLTLVMPSSRGSPRKSVSFRGTTDDLEEGPRGKQNYDSRLYRDNDINGFDASQDEQELIKLMEHQLNQSEEAKEDDVEAEGDVPRLRLSISPVAMAPLSGPPISPQEAEWFLHPKHLGPDTPASQSTPSHARSSGTVGARLALESENGPSPSAIAGGEELTKLQDPSLDALAKTYFPLTLGTSFYIDPGSSASLSYGTHDSSSEREPNLSQPSPPRSTSRPPSRTTFQNGGIQNGQRDSNELHLMRVAAPETASSSTVLLTSPYQVDLAKLRMERLRIEEERLLEMKRIDELERIRGPSDAWYELKNDRFHYEAHKNNEMIRNQNLLGATDEYKTEILRASKQFATQGKLAKSID